MRLPRTVLVLLVLSAMSCAQPATTPEPEVVKEAPPDPAAKPEKRLTFAFQRAPIKTVLDMIARLSDANIIMDSGVSGTVTMSVQNVSWREVLTAVANTFDMKLVWEKNNVVRVVPR